MAARPPADPEHLPDFLERVAHEAGSLAADQHEEAAEVVRAVLGVPGEAVTAGGIEDVQQGLPREIRALWP